MEIFITRPEKKEEEEINRLFSTVIKDTWKKEKIDEIYPEEMKQIIQKKKETLHRDFQTHGHQEYFLVAKIGKKIVGVIAFGTITQDIQKYLKIDFTNTREIKCLYVLPEYQKKGIGKQLFQKIVCILRAKKIEAFCLESGYQGAQKFWKTMLGEANVVIKNLWGFGLHCMIWYRKTEII